jgi:hypothetical protein
MKKGIFILFGLILFGCGNPEYATPEKTLQRYIKYKGMDRMSEAGIAINCFSKADQKWWNEHYLNTCIAMFGTFSAACETKIKAEMSVWGTSFEGAGPSSTNVESSNIDEHEGTATLVVDGKEVYFVKENGDWKLDGFFGVVEQLEEQYPRIKE